MSLSSDRRGERSGGDAVVEVAEDEVPVDGRERDAAAAQAVHDVVGADVSQAQIGPGGVVGGRVPGVEEGKRGRRDAGSRPWKLGPPLGQGQATQPVAVLPTQS